MNDQTVVTVEQRDRALASLSTLSAELARPVAVDRAAAIERDLSLMEDYARSAGLFRPEETLEMRIARCLARWRLGEALQSVERATGPGRGKKDVRARTSFRALLAELGVGLEAALEAQRIACLPFKAFEKFCAGVRKGGGVPDFKELLRFARPYWFQASRKAKHQAIRDRAVMNRLIVGPFPLIYADPPWQFEVYSRETGLERSPDRHYETLSDDEIAAFKVAGKSVREIASDDAALFLWCTSSNVHRALEIMDAWGFTFKTSAVWIKDAIAMGYVFRNRHELLLYGTKGAMPAPQWQPESVFSYPAGEHSAKPAEIRAAIERMYPDFDASTRLELFARGEISGWSTYGLESIEPTI